MRLSNWLWVSSLVFVWQVHTTTNTWLSTWRKWHSVVSWPTEHCGSLNRFPDSWSVLIRLQFSALVCFHVTLLALFTITVDKTYTVITQRRSIAKNVGCFEQRLFVCLCVYYPAICRTGRATKSTVSFFYVCTVTDFSAGALPIGVKSCMAVWPHLRQVFSYFGRIAPVMAEFWALTGRHMAGYASCWSTCLFVNTCMITSERVNIGWWNLGVRCIVQKSCQVWISGS